jgi:DNA-binding transcriptional regulator YhcF (GntR family)
MSVITGNKVPMYSQIAQAIKQRVRTGIYKPGDLLPSVRTIGKEFGVSVKAVHQAIHTLEESGVVQTHPGKGMIVASDETCERAAIIFGLIHPYMSSMGFHRDILEYVDEAFSERSNFIIVRSSKDSPVLERDIAEHLLANGVKGLVVWPTANDPNGEYFQKLSKTVPVVLVDRTLSSAELPTVLLDYYGCGREISEILLGEMNRKRLLVLADNLQISSYRSMLLGIESMARELERMKDLTIVQLPITPLIQKLNKADFSDVNYFADYLERLFREGSYDAIFCTQDEFVDYCYAQTGLCDKFSNIQIATLRSTCPNERSMKYSSLKCMEWYSNSGNMIALAGDMVQRWVLSRQMPMDIVQLKLTLRRS